MDCFPKWMNMCSEGEEELCATEEQKHLFDAYYTIILKEGPLEFDIKIPKAVAQGDVDGLCKLVLRYGGGGNTTGNPGFIAWLKAHLSPVIDTLPIWVSIVMPLLPEHEGYYMWSYNRRCLKYLVERLYDKLFTLYPHMRANLSLEDGILVIGESAGCAWALDAWDSNMINIKAIYLMYPMSDYKRYCSQKYRGITFSRERLKEVALEIIRVAAQIRPGETLKLGRTPPDGMANLPLTATRTRLVINGQSQIRTLWFFLFLWHSYLDVARARAQEQGFDVYRRAASEDLSDTVFVDPQDILVALGEPLLHRLGAKYLPGENALECRLRPLPGSSPQYSPHIFVVHDILDQNCPIEETDEFAELHKRRYPNAPFHYSKVRGSQPAHGFDFYEGCEGVIQKIIETMNWKTPLVKTIAH